MTAWISPGWRSRSTLSTASRPPNRLPMPDARRIASGMTHAPERQHVGDVRDDALRRDDHHQHNNDADAGKPMLCVALQYFLGDQQNNGADGRPRGHFLAADQ